MILGGQVVNADEDDPVLFATAYTRHRIYLFSNREPDADAYVPRRSAPRTRLTAWARSHRTATRPRVAIS
jgi:hypothetical protein